MNNEKISEFAKECLSCKNKPCMRGCPLGNDITSAIGFVKNEQYKEAFDVFAQTSVLMPICGRICPHFKQCQGSCIRGIKGKSVEIGKIESFLGDLAIENNWKLPGCEKEKTPFKVAVVGSGPAGLTCAHFLAREGVDVTIFEKREKLGGILRYGIPDFRLDKNLLDVWIEKILEIGIKVETNKELGKDFDLDFLQKNFDAIFLAFGSNVSSKMGIEGEELSGVFGANEFLEFGEQIDLLCKTCVVSGGGNVAMDIARTLKRGGAKKVVVVYRRSEDEMPAEKQEIEDAKVDGVEFLFLTNILGIFGNKNVEGIKCIKTKLVLADGETRPRPVNIAGSEFDFACDFVFMAVGSKPQEAVVQSLGLETDKYGKIVTQNNKTSRQKVFCGGDLAGAKATVAFAARSGRDGATEILKFLAENKK